MTDNERIAALQAKAEAMGWHWKSFEFAVSYLLVAIGKKYTRVSPVFLDTAATLLAALDPDAVVVAPMGSLGEDNILVASESVVDAPDGKEWVLVQRKKVP